jgi:hypothetical protein
VEFRARCITQLRDGLVRAQERLRRILVTEIGTPIGVTFYGLAGQVSSGGDEHALAVALKIHTATIGGVRQSGLGRRYGDRGFEEYLEVKAIGLPA